MTRVIVTDTLRSLLGNLAQPLELCDDSGQVLARVTPLCDPSEYEAWEPPISEEELRRRESSDKWYSTAQVLARLNNLEKQ